MLRIARNDVERMYAQVLEEYPHECCGILSEGAEGGISTAHVCENMQQRRHEEDPERYPRDARTAYLIDPVEQMRINEAAEKTGGGSRGSIIRISIVRPISPKRTKDAPGYSTVAKRVRNRTIPTHSIWLFRPMEKTRA